MSLVVEPPRRVFTSSQPTDGYPGIGTEGPHQSAELSNNAGPHHGAVKLSIARADYLLTERVTIAANGNQ